MSNQTQESQVLSSLEDVMEQSGYGHRVTICVEGTCDTLSFSVPKLPETIEEWGLMLKNLGEGLLGPKRKATEEELAGLDAFAPPSQEEMVKEFTAIGQKEQGIEHAQWWKDPENR